MQKTSQNADEPSTTSMSFDLPIPVVQKQPFDSSLRRKFTFVSQLNCALYTKTTNIFRRVQKTLAAPSSSTVVRESLEGIQHALDNNRYALEEDQAVEVAEVNEDDVVEEVVVDRAWNEASTKTSLKSKALSESDGGEVCSEAPASVPGIQDPMKRPALFIVFWTVYSHWQQFFNPIFKDINKEIHYQKENWAHSKRLSLWASVFFIGNWILGAALIPTPAVLLDKVRRPTPTVSIIITNLNSIDILLRSALSQHLLTIRRKMPILFFHLRNVSSSLRLAVSELSPPFAFMSSTSKYIFSCRPPRAALCFQPSERSHEILSVFPFHLNLVVVWL